MEEESDIPAKSNSAILGQFSPTFPDTASFLLGSGWWLQDTDGQRTGMDRGHRERRQRTRMAAPPVTASVKVTIAVATVIRGIGGGGVDICL